MASQVELQSSLDQMKGEYLATLDAKPKHVTRLCFVND